MEWQAIESVGARNRLNSRATLLLGYWRMHYADKPSNEMSWNALTWHILYRSHDSCCMQAFISSKQQRNGRGMCMCDARGFASYRPTIDDNKLNCRIKCSALSALQCAWNVHLAKCVTAHGPTTEILRDTRLQWRIFFSSHFGGCCSRQRIASNEFYVFRRGNVAEKCTRAQYNSFCVVLRFCFKSKREFPIPQFRSFRHSAGLQWYKWRALIRWDIAGNRKNELCRLRGGSELKIPATLGSTDTRRKHWAHRILPDLLISWTLNISIDIKLQ